jgi:hypothetical protein
VKVFVSLRFTSTTRPLWVAALAGWLVDAVRQLSYRPVRGVLPPPRGVVTQAMRLLWFVALLRCAQAAPSPQLPFNNGQQLTVRTQELQLRPTFDAPASPPLLLGHVRCDHLS